MNDKKLLKLEKINWIIKKEYCFTQIPKHIKLKVSLDLCYKIIYRLFGKPSKMIQKSCNISQTLNQKQLQIGYFQFLNNNFSREYLYNVLNTIYSNWAS